jgi:putative transposase
MIFGVMGTDRLDHKNQMARPKHTDAEITAKLAQAGAMEAEGTKQPDIARALGISVMTLHRWREKATVAETAARTAELELENSRLRRLITDLLLEKMKLQGGIKK